MSLLLTSDSNIFCLFILTLIETFFGDFLDGLNSLISVHISEKYVQKEVVPLK